MLCSSKCFVLLIYNVHDLAHVLTLAVAQCKDLLKAIYHACYTFWSTYNKQLLTIVASLLAETVLNMGFLTKSAGHRICDVTESVITKYVIFRLYNFSIK